MVTRLHKSQQFTLKLRRGFWRLFEQPLPDFATLRAARSNDIALINKHFWTYVMRCYILVYSASVIHPPTLSTTHNLYSSQRTSSIRTVNSCRTIGVEHAAGMEGIHKYIIRILVGTPEGEKPHWSRRYWRENNLELFFYEMGWIGFMWLISGSSSKSLFSTVIKLRVSYKVRNLSNSVTSVSRKGILIQPVSSCAPGRKEMGKSKLDIS